MGDKLTEIPQNDLKLLRKLYAASNGTPKEYMALMTIDNYISLFEQDPGVENVKFYCLNGDFLANGTFVVTVSFQ